jgi:hypothetical protein
MPRVLARPDGDEAAVKQLTRYFGPSLAETDSFTGAAFDGWDSTGKRSHDRDRFTADDLVAVTFLSVDVGPRAAHALLREKAEQFSRLLGKVGPDRDLAFAVEVLDDSWVGWTLDRELRALPDVGPTTASKLFARKRPRLRPIFDSVVARVLGTAERHWQPIHHALAADDAALHRRLLRLRDAAGLSEEVSALRVLDVLAWLEGKDGAN